MSKRYPPAQFVLPAVVDPPRICTTIYVPNDPQHIAAFLGVIYNLSMSASWARDLAHTAADVSRVWTDVFNNIIIGSCATPGDDMQFRQNGCKIEFSIDCVNWQTLYDPTGCIPGLITQPNPGGTLIPGQCAEYDVTLQGNGQWLSPVPVDDGYTIEITGQAGAWTDGGGFWACPDGTPFVLGICSGTRTTDGSDPAPTLHHKSLIGNINGVYFEPDAGIYTVPVSTGSQQLTFQMNDSNLADNAGSISFHVKVCNVPVPTWCYNFDFSSSDGGFVDSPSGAGHWDGTAWIADNVVISVQRTIVQIEKIFSTSQVTKIELTYDYHHGTLVNGVIGVAIIINSSVAQVLMQDTVDGDGQTLVWTGNETATDFFLDVEASHGAYGGSAKIHNCRVFGTGTNPFGADNC